jgi:hypothetical protein
VLADEPTHKVKRIVVKAGASGSRSNGTGVGRSTGA